jgi:hypothetical protein
MNIHKERRVVTLVINKIFTWACKNMKSMAKCMIWIWICYLAVGVVFYNLQEAGVELKVPV